MVTSRNGTKGTRAAAQLRPIWKAVEEACNPRSTRGELNEHERDDTITSSAKEVIIKVLRSQSNKSAYVHAWTSLRKAKYRITI